VKQSIIAFYLLLFAVCCFADIIHVPGDYPTIQEGIDAANPGDIVMVATGTYPEEITLKADVDVIGAGEGQSIIDGGGDPGDVVYAVGNSITNDTKFQGFTVTGAANSGGMPGGGGIFCNSGAAPEICNCRVEGNDQGIAMWNQSSAYLHNNVVVNNTYTGISISSASLIINNTVAGNSNGMYDSGGWLPTIMNNVVTGNSNIGLGCVNNSVPTNFSYNDVWGNGTNYHYCSAGPGSISEDPVYVDETNGDYHLDTGSPCIDAGNPAAQYNDPDGSRNDMGAYGGPGAEVPLPQVNLTSPAQHALHVPYDSDVSAVFTVDMDGGTFDASSFRLSGLLSGFYAGTVSYDSAGKMATLDPDSLFSCGEVMTALITADVVSTSGDTFSGFAWQFTAMVDGGSAVFELFNSFAVGTSPMAVIAADVDHDGDLDLASANETSADVSVLLGNGDGTFGAALPYGVGTTPVAICCGDFNDDGDPDLAVANSASNNVSILLGNGSSGFGSASNYATDIGPNGICCADFSFDGVLDLATSSGIADNVSVLLGNGDGSFGLDSSYSLNTTPEGIVTGDVNNDGIFDLATANQSNTITILFGNGDGTFDTTGAYTTASSPRELCCGDFDGDGFLDVATANEGSNNVSILVNDGAGGFNSPVNYSVGVNPYAIITSDFDGDGRMDLATVNESGGSVSILRGDGDGTFQPSSEYVTGDNPQWIFGGDFDADGDIDLCTADQADNAVSILLNSDGLEVIATDPSQYEVGVSINATVTAVFNLELDPATIDSTSFLLYGSQTGKHPGFISYDPDCLTATLYPNDGFIEGEFMTAILTKDVMDTNNVYLEGFAWDFSSGITTPSSGTFVNRQDYWVGNEPRGFYAGDLDGDWDIDLAVTLNQGAVAVLLNDGTGTFTGPSNNTCSLEPIALFGGDLDWDGDIDLAVINNRPGSANLDILINDGNATFSLGFTYTLSVMGNSIDGGDLDGDGDIDIVVSSYWGSNDNVYVMLNNGNGSFSGPYIYTAGTWAHGVAARDVDNDGDVDLSVANGGNNNVSVLLNDGDGVFGDLANYAVGSSPYDIYGFDFNGDRYVDLATANYGSSDVTVILNNGNGTFGSAANYAAGSSTRYLTCGDLDGDNDIDIIASANGTDTVSVLLNNGNGTFGSTTPYQVGSTPWGVQASDFDLDGDLDIAVANYNSDNVSILFNTGTGVEELEEVTLKRPYLKAYPTVFSNSVIIEYCLGKNSGATELQVYDVTGRLVKRFVLPTAYSLLPTSVSWDGRDERGRTVASGVYFCRLASQDLTITKKVLCIR
jgi:parallel beta-helix repeat protein